MQFERPNSYGLTLTHPLDRILFKGPVPEGLRELRRPKEAVEAWEVLEASFYPGGVADFRLARHERVKEAFQKTDRFWIETVSADDLWRGLHPERTLAPLIVSLANDQVSGSIAQLAAWTVFDRLVLRANNRRLRSLLPDDHWLILEMDGIETEVGAVHRAIRHQRVQRQVSRPRRPPRWSKRSRRRKQSVSRSGAVRR
jgi:hypothetical protein